MKIFDVISFKGLTKNKRQCSLCYEYAYWFEYFFYGGWSTKSNDINIGHTYVCGYCYGDSTHNLDAVLTTFIEELQ